MSTRKEAAVAQYIALSDKIAELERATDAAIQPYKDKQDQIRRWLLATMQAEGEQSFRTTKGTVYQKVTRSYSPADWTVFADFVERADQADMIERKVCGKAVSQYVKEVGEVPPGLNCFSKASVGILRA